MGLKLAYPEGPTPLDPDESARLIPSHIATQGQLNEWEQQNILDGERWAFSRRNLNPLSLQFSQDLHKHMFGRTWKWAGRFRTNGNGRFSRTMADLLLKSKGEEEFTWGGGNLNAGEIRNKYISALRAADARDLRPLFAFVRSGEKD